MKGYRRWAQWRSQRSKFKFIDIVNTSNVWNLLNVKSKEGVIVEEPTIFEEQATEELVVSVSLLPLKLLVFIGGDIYHFL